MMIFVEILIFVSWVFIAILLTASIYADLCKKDLARVTEQHIEEEDRLKRDYNKKLVEKDLVIDSFESEAPYLIWKKKYEEMKWYYDSINEAFKKEEETKRKYGNNSLTRKVFEDLNPDNWEQATCVLRHKPSGIDVWISNGVEHTRIYRPYEIKFHPELQVEFREFYNKYFA